MDFYLKQAELIKTRKDIDYLLENYFNYTSLSRVLDINPKVLRDFILLGRTPQDAKFYVIRKKVKFIMKQMNDAELYNPSPLWVET